MTIKYYNTSERGQKTSERNQNTSDTENSDLRENKPDMDVIEKLQSDLQGFHKTVCLHSVEFVLAIITAIKVIEGCIDSFLENACTKVTEEIFKDIESTKSLVDDVIVQENNIKSFCREKPVPCSIELYSFTCDRFVSNYKKSLEDLSNTYYNLLTNLLPLLEVEDRDSSCDMTNLPE